MSNNNSQDAEIVEQKDNGQLPSDGANGTDLLHTAVQQGADTDTLERLIDLKERQEANTARKAYDAAMADLRSDLPTIEKNNKVSHKGASYDYEGLSTIVEKVSPVMAEHDLSFRWRTDSEQANEVKVTCIISHRDGHSEETTLSAQPDTSGSKNSIQAIGSTVTYLQRYTLKAALGIAAGPDDDANSVSDSKQSRSNTNTGKKDVESKESPKSYQSDYKEAQKKASGYGLNTKQSHDDLVDQIKTVEQFIDHVVNEHSDRVGVERKHVEATFQREGFDQGTGQQLLEVVSTAEGPDDIEFGDQGGIKI
jgi:hypothetical protein